MGVLAIVQPITLQLAGGIGFASGSLAVTPDPKEAALCDGTAGANLLLSFVSTTLIDTVLVGYTNASTAASVRCQLYDGPGTTLLDDLTVSAAPGDGNPLAGVPQHFLFSFATPRPAGFIRISSAASFTNGLSIGVAAAGLAFRPTYPQEFGGGRQLTDTGSVQRLMGGGFAVDPGAVVGDWQWTLSDLSDAELRQLWALARSRGLTRSVLVVEDPDQTAGLNERIHWGLFGKLDVYERRDVNLNRWNMTVQDWG